MSRTITRTAAAAVVALTIMTTAPGAGGASEPIDPYPDLPTGMAGVEGEITRIYQAVLDRSPDEDGLSYWAEQRQAGVELTVVVGSFRTSPEFELRFASMLDAPVEDWVETMYQRVLGRSSDAAGKAYWTDLVDSGVSSREQLIIHFADSVEYRIATGTGREGFAHRVEQSRDRYAALGDDYRYRVDFETWVGFGWTTDFVVADGVVEERSYEERHVGDDQFIVEESWTETGIALGSHESGAPVRTVDELHDDCLGLLDTLDARRHQLMVRTDDDGLLTLCGGVDPIVADSPGTFVTIAGFAPTD